MKLKYIKKIKYYFKLAIKKPYLIESFVYTKHLGVILLIPIDKNKEISKINLDSKINIVVTNDIEEIWRFYKRMKRDSVDKETIKNWLDNNFECFLVCLSNGISIGGMWIFKNKFTLNSTSGRTLSPKKTIVLDEQSLYGAFAIIDKEFRGKGINQLLLKYVIDYYATKSNYKKLLLITGANNGAYIRTTMKKGAKLIGITEVINILGHKCRKKIFLDEKERVWNN